MSSPTSPFLAYIIPVNSDAHPEHPIVIPPGQPQPPTDAHPEHPIVIPPVYPAHPIYLPGLHPEHPIVLPPEQPQPPTDAHPEHPIYYPPFPAHPIVLPDPPTEPPPGGQAGTPEHPINLPPPDLIGQSGHWVQAYFPQLNGWIWVWVPAANTPPHPAHPIAGVPGKKK